MLMRFPPIADINLQRFIRRNSHPISGVFAEVERRFLRTMAILGRRSAAKPSRSASIGRVLCTPHPWIDC